jgi:hypothetical protein
MSNIDKVLLSIDGYCNSLSGSVVEIGATRGGGKGSTEALATFCDERDLKFYSIDFEDSAFFQAEENPKVNAYQMTGEEFLAEVFSRDEKICLAYLDNFDFVFTYIEGKSWVLSQIALYKRYGFEMTNEASKKSHLHQATLIEQLAAEKCIIILDDTWEVEEGVFDGKGGLAFPFLRSKGFEVLYMTSSAKPHFSYIILGRL